MRYFKLQKFESQQLIDDMTINFFITLKFCKHEKYMKIMQSNGRFVKIHIELRNIGLGSSYT